MKLYAVCLSLRVNACVGTLHRHTFIQCVYQKIPINHTSVIWQEPISHCFYARLSQNNDTMELKSILSPQVLNIHDEEPVSIKTMAGFLAILLDVEAMEVDIPHSFLDACCAT